MFLLKAQPPLKAIAVSEDTPPLDGETFVNDVLPQANISSKQKQYTKIKKLARLILQ